MGLTVMENDYPRVLYHVAVEQPRNRYGRPVAGDLRYVGDLANPNYPTPNTVVNAQGLRGRQLGKDSDHTIVQHPYKTMILALYNGGGGIDVEACEAKEAELAQEGWVRSPDMLKYDE